MLAFQMLSCFQLALNQLKFALLFLSIIFKKLQAFYLQEEEVAIKVSIAENVVLDCKIQFSIDMVRICLIPVIALACLGTVYPYFLKSLVSRKRRQ